MLVMRHTPESCPGREENADIHPCLHAMDELARDRGFTIVGRWADPPAHVSWIVMDAPDAHAIQGVLAESGLFAHTTTEIRAVHSAG